MRHVAVLLITLCREGTGRKQRGATALQFLLGAPFDGGIAHLECTDWKYAATLFTDHVGYGWLENVFVMVS
jgi:hypothetical protein